MVVEHFSEKYREDVLELVRLLNTDSLKEYIGEFDKSWVSRIPDECIRNHNEENSFVMVCDGKCVGAMYGMVYNCKMNEGMIYHETFLYIRKEYRKYSLKFIREIQSILQKRGINYIIMTVLEDYQAEPLRRFYTRLGYKPLERHFIRSLNGLP